jgi:tetratricopeptide (TPR) repeat protein/precorrin-6B methylase 2
MVRPMSDPFQTALQHQQAGRLNQAAEIYQNMLRGNPQQPDVLHQFGLLHHQAGRPAEGVKYIQRAIALRPGQSAYLNNAALLFIAAGQAAEAVRAAEQALASDPGSADAANNLGLAQAMLGNTAAAEAAYRRAMSLRSPFLEARFNLANLLRDRGDHAAAITEYRGLLESHPQFIAARVNLGIALELSGDLDAAIATYAAAAQQQPDLAPAHLNLGLALQKRHRFREAIAALQTALKHDPRLVAAHMAIGQSARELGDSSTATAAFQAAAKLAPDLPEVQEALSALLSGAIPGWHFPMLADAARNAAFNAALEKAITPDTVVLDIGTGSGLLAMMAARAGAKQVVACEAHPLIAETAREIVAKNNYAGRIAVLAQRSTELDPARDMGGPDGNRLADLVVAEVLDAGLIGEGMLPTSRDALKRLARPGAKIIPAAAQVLAQVVTLPQQRLVNPLRDLCGFDLSPFDRFRNRSAHGSVRLDHEPHTALSAVLPVQRIDFAAPPDWTRPQTLTWAAPIDRAGQAQALVFWFELWLDEAIMLSTGPGGAMRHWGQAVCWLPEDRMVQPGDSLAFRVTLADTFIDFALL